LDQAPKAPAPPAPPRFPTLEELLGLELEDAPTERRNGLLDALLGGSPLPIYYDAQEHPEKYRPEDRELLETVVARGTKEFSEEERRRLDHMVLTFATAERIKPLPHKPPAPKPQKRPLRQTELPSFWWLNR